MKIKNHQRASTLILSWQSSDISGRRYGVGYLKRVDQDTYEFSYNFRSKEFEEAKMEGFQGYPGFDTCKEKFPNQKLITFSKRLPPKSRNDFVDFLGRNLIKMPFSGSDFELLGQVGIKLPSDGFDLIPDLSTSELPFDYLTEVAGARYHITLEEFESLAIGEKLHLKDEPCNENDSNAIAIYHNSQKIGYVNRLLCNALKKVRKNSDIEAFLAKKVNSKRKPLIYALISAKSKTSRECFD